MMLVGLHAPPGWTDARFHAGLYSAALARLHQQQQQQQPTSGGGGGGGPSAVQLAVARVLSERLEGNGGVVLAAQLSEEDRLLRHDEAFAGRPLYLPPAAGGPMPGESAA